MKSILRLQCQASWDMIFRVTTVDETHETNGNALCKSCGLCCTGHLFAWTKLRSAELDAAETLGLKVLRSIPSQRGFNQPCPLWQGQCTVYSSPHYPHFCRTYKCKLLKKVLDESTSLAVARETIDQAKAMIHELTVLLPPSPNTNFRERLVDYLEMLEKKKNWDKKDLQCRLKADALLAFYSQVFGVDDLVENPWA